MILQTISFCSRYASNRHAKQYLVSHYFTHRHGDGIFSHQLVFFLIYFGSEHLLNIYMSTTAFHPILGAMFQRQG